MGETPIIKLSRKSLLGDPGIQIPSSKSESNRALILNALAGSPSEVEGISHAEDTEILASLLLNDKKEQNVQDAGTAMRFLTAYYVSTNDQRILTGSERMKQRPIGELVSALRAIGAHIQYLENEGYPPIKIDGFPRQKTSEIQIRGDVSSQFISALLLIAPSLPEGLNLHVLGSVVSAPYIDLTLDMLQQCGVRFERRTDTIQIKHQPVRPYPAVIGGDWSSASYFYSFLALSDRKTLRILGLQKDSAQGDRQIAFLMESFGIKTRYESSGVELTKEGPLGSVDFDMTGCPDLVPTLVFLCAGRRVPGTFRGIEHLRLKESDRIDALQIELDKLGCSFSQISEGVYEILPIADLPADVHIDTYGDHRMAMAAAPLSTRMDMTISDPSVVSKSFPDYWGQVQAMEATLQFSN